MFGLRGKLSRETEFFQLFSDSAELICEGANRFRTLVADLDHAETHVRAIMDIENRADQITHRTIELLHTTFITPFDRDDIHKLICTMDDILDFIDAASQRIFYYQIDKVTDDTFALAEKCFESATHIKQAVKGLKDLKNPTQLFKSCIEINKLENDADHILRTATARLFKEETDIRALIKLKEIYELLETVTDRCEDVANVIEGIVLEYA